MIAILTLVATLTAADCQKNMSFSIQLKPHGYVCLANSGDMYVEPGTHLDAAAQMFLRTLSDTARRLNENEMQQPKGDAHGT